MRSDCKPFTAERTRLWERLAIKVADVTTAPGDIVANVLSGVCSGLELSRRELTARERQASYWKERAWVEAQLARLSESPVVRHLTWEIDFFAPQDALRCQHGRQRKVCERIHGLLLWCEADGLCSASRSRMLAKRRAEVLRELSWYGLDPEKQRPNNFCAPPLQAPGTGMPEIKPAGRGGRPLDSVGSFLLDRVVGRLTDAGMDQRDACLILSEVHELCFGKSIAPESLAKQWRTSLRDALPSRPHRTARKPRADRKKPRSKK